MKDKNKQDYFKNFINNAIYELRTKGICYVYNKEQVDELERRLKRKLVVKELDFGINKGYSVTFR